jgi:3-deoxy-D-manno-octulosonate 8-phosphate phosphatase (KDO 8-P phosphatase)
MTGLTDANVACIGDDWMDVPLFQRAALAIAVPEADPFTQSHAHCVTAAPGGNGAVREAVEALLHAKNLLDRIRLSFAGLGS